MIHMKEVREIMVTEFTPESAIKFREQCTAVSIMNPEMPIIVYINSPGGQVYSLLSMLSTIDELPNRFVTVCTGMAASCGAVLLSYGDARFITPHSDVMIHRVSAFTYGDVKTMIGDVRQIEKLNARVMGILADRCKKTPMELEALVKSMDNQEVWLNAEEAKTFGIVDYIGSPDLKPDVAWNLTQTAAKERMVAVDPDEYKEKQLKIKEAIDKVEKELAADKKPAAKPVKPAAKPSKAIPYKKPARKPGKK